MWSVVHPDRLFLIRVSSDEGREYRQIYVRRTGTPELVSNEDNDPAYYGYAEWDVEVTAFDPWWYGAPITDEYVTDDDAVHEETLHVSNPGDQDAWLRWIIREAPDYTVLRIPDGLGVYPEGHDDEGERITHTLPIIEAGKHGLIDTSPQRLPLTVKDEPMAFGKLRQTRFTHPIPPNTDYADLPITIQGGATGSGVRVKLTPRYERPYGRTR